MKTAIILSSCFAALLLMTGCQTAAQTSNVPLEGTDWILAELNGQPVVFGQNQRTSTLKLDPATKHASGMSGANRFSGPYELNGSKLKFGNTMGTRMAGPPEAMAAKPPSSPLSSKSPPGKSQATPSNSPTAPELS